MNKAGLKRLTVLLLATAPLAACGSTHRAPVVYGTQPYQQTARIYNSPAESAAARTVYSNTGATGYAPSAYGASSYSPSLDGIVLEPAVARGPVPLTPVAETWREERRGAMQPTYIAENNIDIFEPAAEMPGQLTVRPGDTVYAIARRTGATPQAIISLNRLAPPYRLEVGEIIRVPANSVPPSRAAAAAEAAAPPRAGAHVVRAGDTLYSISRATGVPVDQIAQANSIGAPYSLRVGQTLKIPGGSGAIAAAAPQAPEADVGDLARNVSYGSPAAKPATLFDWPVQGRVIGVFGLSQAGKRNDGVNIAAPVGTPVRAAADGEVVYRGSELEGYGNLLLIKHEDGFVTAYAHNDAMLVKKGDRVRKGQVIAKVGQTGSASEPQLHFEIRQNLKAIDPVALMGSL
ncbi:MAG: peptidoglycan DD-metalloendopeptidase family protein [Parvularculaceae bacterium]